MENKRGQMKLSFGRIFSIILAIVFIGFAIYGITQFLSLKDSAQAGKFRQDFTSDLEEVWRSSEASTSKSYALPSDYTKVCVNDDEENNLEMHKEDLEFPEEHTIQCGEGANCVNVESSPQCVDVEGGEFSFNFEKSSDDAKVTVSAG